ncbi:hypothetical protein IJ818_04140 [bacterium]|nr:hypothetical protein [bacterium]
MERILEELKHRKYLKGIKIEFESEVVSDCELNYLSSLLKNLDIDLTVKLGGATSLLDVKKARDLNAKAIVAPMVESSYTVKKFLSTVKTIYGNVFPDLYLNIETTNAFTYLYEIFEVSQNIKGMVLGRSDLTSSLGMDKSTVNCQKIEEYASMLQGFCHTNGKSLIIGGNVDLMSLPFFKRLIFLSGFETRKVIFDSSLVKNSNDFEENLILAFKFELEWIKNKEYITKDDEIRLQSLNQKIEVLDYYKNLA